MKSRVMKLFITAGILAGGLLTFCPYVMPTVNQAFAPPSVQKPKPVIPPPGIKHVQKIEDLVFEMTNQARRAKGLAPLHKDDELTNVARAYSDDMLVRHFFDHTTPDGISFDERIANHYNHRIYLVGENIWSGSGYNSLEIKRVAKEIMADWMSSPGHRENLLSPKFTHLGVGVSAGHNKILATQEFVGRFNEVKFGDLARPWIGNLNNL
jgi:uncharacterized protein YkwD